MTNRDFCRSLREVDDVLSTFALTEETRKLVSLTPSEVFRRAALTPGSSYLHLYRTGLANFDYNFLLTDLSFFQFYCSETGIRPGVRYAYYPNPYPLVRFDAFATEYGELLDEVTYDDYLQHLSELPPRHGAPLIRFDLAVTDHKPREHPAAHFHIGFDHENRWPCARVLTPKAFAMLIIKQYYPDKWATARPEIEDAFASSKASSRPLETELFSVDEQRQFHLS